MPLFTRFYLTRAGITEFRVRVLWEDHPTGIPAVIGNFGVFRVQFARQAAVHDHPFNLHNILIQGVGMHIVELLREKRLDWTTDDSIPIARTFFVVER